MSCHTRAGGAPFAGGVPFVHPAGHDLLDQHHARRADRDRRVDRSGSAARACSRAGRATAATCSRPFLIRHSPRLSDADVTAIYAFLRTRARRDLPAAGKRRACSRCAGRWRCGTACTSSPALRADPVALGGMEPRRVPGRGAWALRRLPYAAQPAARRARRQASCRAESLQVALDKHRARRWSAVDLTPSARGLRSWSVAELTQYFQTGVSARAGSFGPMNEVIVNSLRAADRRRTCTRWRCTSRACRRAPTRTQTVQRRAW